MIHSNVRMHSSHVVSYINVDGHDPMPVYGCGKSRKALTFYDLKQAKKLNLCLDWMHNRCVYAAGDCKYKHELPPAKSEDELQKMKWRSGQSALKAKTGKKKMKVVTTFLGKTIVGTKALNRPAKSSWAQRVPCDLPRETEANVFAEDMSTSGSKTGSDLSEAQPEPKFVAEATWDDDVVEPILHQAAPVATSVPVETQIYLPTDFEPVIVAPPTPIVEPLRAPAPETEPFMHFEPAPLARSVHAPILDPHLLALNAHAPSYAPSYSGSLFSEDQCQTMSTSHTPPQSTHTEPAYYQPSQNYQRSQMVPPQGYQMVQQKNAQLTAQVNSHKSAHEQIHQDYQTELGKVQQETVLLTQVHERAVKRFALEKSQLRLQYERQVAELRKQLADERATSAARLEENESLKKQALLQQAAPVQVPEVEIVQHVQQEVVQPAQEVVQPAEEGTCFTSDPWEILVPPMEAPEVASVVEEAVLEPMPEQATTTEDQATAEEAEATPVEEATPVVVEAPVRQRRKRRVRRSSKAVCPKPQQQVPEPQVATLAQVAVPVEEAIPDQEAAPVLGATPVQEAIPQQVEEAAPQPVLKAEEYPTLKQLAKKTVWGTPAAPVKHSKIIGSKPVSTQTTATVKTCASSKASKKSVQCIFDKYDMAVGRKESVCYDWLCGICKCENCASFEGCFFPYGRCSHMRNLVEGGNCYFHHRVPSVKKQKPLATDELSYRQRGVKKTRMSKRDRFNRNNRLSLEAVKSQRQTTKPRLMKVIGTGIAARS